VFGSPPSLDPLCDRGGLRRCAVSPQERRFKGLSGPAHRLHRRRRLQDHGRRRRRRRPRRRRRRRFRCSRQGGRHCRPVLDLHPRAAALPPEAEANVPSPGLEVLIDRADHFAHSWDVAIIFIRGQSDFFRSPKQTVPPNRGDLFGYCDEGGGGGISLARYQASHASIRTVKLGITVARTHSRSKSSLRAEASAAVAGTEGVMGTAGVRSARKPQHHAQARGLLRPNPGLRGYSRRPVLSSSLSLRKQFA